MSGHTPGKWQTGGMLILTEEPSTVAPDGRTINHWKEIAEVRYFSGPLVTCDEGEANARLIASAPDLLAAARLANQELIDLGVGSSGSPALVALWSAIAKAEGGDA